MGKRICSNCGADSNPDSARFCISCGHELEKSSATVNVEPHFQKPIKQKKGINKKQLLGTVVGVLVFWAAYYGVQQIFFPPFDIDKVLVHTASEFNKMCPIMADQHTRLDNAEAFSNNTFQYNYTLIGEAMASVNPDSLKNYLEPRIINIVKTGSDMSFFRERKTTMVFNYRNEKGEFVTKVTVKPGMYKK